MTIFPSVRYGKKSLLTETFKVEKLLPINHNKTLQIFFLHIIIILKEALVFIKKSYLDDIKTKFRPRLLLLHFG